jgi:hypothetical protein
LKRISIVSSLFAGLGMLVVSTALAGGSTTVGAYGGTAAGTQGQIGATPTGQAGLPFTGLSVASIVVIALGLVVVGYVLRRRPAND